MLREPQAVPDVKSPRPMATAGEGYILALWLPNAFLDTQTFLPPEQAASHRGVSLRHVCWITQHRQSGRITNCCSFPAVLILMVKRHLSISRFVSSWENGQQPRQPVTSQGSL